jgi:hypothetical protein
MSDAVRNVTILMNIKAGTIEAPDLSPWAAARTAVSELNTGMKSLTETQKQLAESEQTLGQAARETVQQEDNKAKMHKTVETAAKQSADVQVEQSNRVVETVAKNMKTLEEMTARRPLREPGASVPTGTPEEITARRPLREPGESGPSSQQTVVSPAVDGRKASLDGLADYSEKIEAQIDTNKAKYEKEQTVRQQKQAEEQQRMIQKEAEDVQRAEEQMAAAHIRSRTALAKQQERQHADEEAAMHRETELSIAEAQKQAEQESAAFDQADQQRAKEEAAVEAQTQKEVAENEKALQKKTNDEMKFRENMRNQRIAEEAATASATAKEEAEKQKSLKKQAAAELKFSQDMRNQRIAEEEAELEAAQEQAESILEFRSRMNQQRLREEEATTQAVLQAQNKLPVLLRGVQQDMSQTIGATAQFISHLSMLDSIGGESLENIAKKFAEIQSTVGLISSSQSMFSNVGEGLGKLQQMGAATQTIVDSQTKLGVATTFSQGATLKLAGAAGTLQAAMGPISLIMTGVMVAIVLAELAMDAFGGSAEEAAEKLRKQEEAAERFNRQLEFSIHLLEQEKSVLDSQTDIMNTQWEIKKALAGDKGLSAGDMKKEVDKQTQQQNDAMNQEINIGAKKLEEVISKPNQEKAKGLLDTEQELIARGDRLEKNRRTRDAAGEDTVSVDTEIADNKKRLEQNAIEQEAMVQSTGVGVTLQDIVAASPEQAQSLGSTEIKDGMIVDFAAMEQNLEAIPDKLALQFLQDIQEPMQEQATQTQQSLGEAQRSLADAEIKKKKAEQGIADEETRFNAEEDMASKFGLDEGKDAKEQAMAALDRFDAAKTPEEKAMAADEAESILSGANILSTEAEKMLRGENTDTKAARNQINDDSEISQEEKTQNDKTVADLTDMKMEADAAILAMPRLIEDLKAKLKAINDQQTQLSNAMRVRDGI